jgi:hypothetical protein
VRVRVLAGVVLLTLSASAAPGCSEPSSWRAPGGEGGRERSDEQEPGARPTRPGDLAVHWSAVLEVATGEAHQGPWRMNESDFRFVDDPTVALAGDGEVGVAWVDQARKDVFFQRFGPGGEARHLEPVNVSRSPDTFSWLPRLWIAAGEPGEVFVLWQEIFFSGGSHGGEIFFARSTDGGRTFSRPRNLSNTPAGAGKGRLTREQWHNGSLDLARGPAGELYAAWTEYEGTLWFRRSTDAGESFSPPVTLAGGRGEGAAAGPARGPSLAVGLAGTVYLAWTVGEDPAADLRLARSRDGGRSFDAPRVLLAGPGHADAPKLAVDGAGTLHLAWAESGEGPFGRYRVLYARSTDGGEGFEGAREISGGHAEGFDSTAFPDLALDGAGNPYALWHLFPDPRQRPRGLGFAVSRDGGRSFSPPVIVPGTAEPELGTTGSRQGLLGRKLAVDRAGEIAVVNSTFQANERSRVRLIRGRPGDL